MRVLALTSVLAVTLGVATVKAQPAADRHVVGAFAMSGVVTKAHNVRGEYRGQRVKRTWRFQSVCSTPASCKQLVVARVRASGKSDLVTLNRVAPGVYAGTGKYPIPLQCGRQRLPAGGTGSYSLSVRIGSSRPVQNVRFATRIVARYRSVSRVNGTRCPGFLGSDTATFLGRLVALPSPPRAAFASTRESAPPAIFSFTDGSTPGRGGAAIVARQWDFGDPGSGQANTDTSPTPSHTYLTLGVHTVTLTVTDANGLTATTRQQVTA